MTDYDGLDTMIAGTQLSIVGLAIAHFISTGLGFTVLLFGALVTASSWSNR